MILCVGTTPAAQRVMVFPHWIANSVNRSSLTIEGAAGKSVNVAKVLRALGEEPVVLSFLGGIRGEFVRAVLAQRGIDLACVPVAEETRLCVTVVDEATGNVTELVEESASVTTQEANAMRDQAKRLIPSSRAVVMSGSLAPGMGVEFYFQCCQWAKQAGAFTMVDARGEALLRALPARPDLVKPNKNELEATAGRPLPDTSSTRRAMEDLRERGAASVVVTHGPDPILAFDGSALWRIAPPKVKALNPIGSGDAFTAGLTWRLLKGDDLGEACRWGCACGVANSLSILAGELARAEVEHWAGKVSVEVL